jgi:hypothetical protein
MQTTDSSGESDARRNFAGTPDVAASIRELIELWRVMYQPFLPAAPAGGPQEAANASGPASAVDPVHLVLRANSLLLESGMRYWLRWQEIVSVHVPAITRSLESCKIGERPNPEAGQDFMHALRSYLREAAALPCEHCRRVQEDLRALEQELFGDAAQDAYRRRHKYKG